MTGQKGAKDVFEGQVTANCIHVIVLFLFINEIYKYDFIIPLTLCTHLGYMLSIFIHFKCKSILFCTFVVSVCAESYLLMYEICL